MAAEQHTWKELVWEHVCKVAAAGEYFSMDDLRPFFSKMVESKGTKNRFIGEKVRQQLQILRNEGLLIFVVPGSYRRV